MAGDGPVSRGAGWAKQLGRTVEPKIEQPTQAAELKLTVGPATAGGHVPQSEAHHFVTVSGIAVCVAAAIAGVVLTLQIAGPVFALRVGSGLTVLALAELGLGLLGSVLIAACGRRADHRTDEAGKQAPDKPHVSADAGDQELRPADRPGPSHSRRPSPDAGEGRTG
jgi:hypothetical protein